MVNIHLWWNAALNISKKSFLFVLTLECGFGTKLKALPISKSQLRLILLNAVLRICY